MPICGIYKITNTFTKKIYIGQSVDIKRRWIEHKNRAFNHNTNCYNSVLYSSMRKYGLKFFIFEIIEECEADKLNEREQYYINKYNTITPNGYNIKNNCCQMVPNIRKCSECGAILSKGTHTICADCAHKKIRKVKNRPSPEELQQMLIDTNFEEVARKYHVSSNSVRKWCDLYGMSRHSQDYKKKDEKKTIKSVTRPYKIPVKKIDIKTGEVISVYDSAASAAKELGKSKGSHITEVCKNINKTAYGYKWEYA